MKISAHKKFVNELRSPMRKIREKQRREAEAIMQAAESASNKNKLVYEEVSDIFDDEE